MSLKQHDELLVILQESMKENASTINSDQPRALSQSFEKLTVKDPEDDYSDNDYFDADDDDCSDDLYEECICCDLTNICCLKCNTSNVIGNIQHITGFFTFTNPGGYVLTFYTIVDIPPQVA